MITDAEVGRTVALCRTTLATSQAELAAQMTARGWSWTQSTVSAIEHGERTLKLAEAHDLADLLEVPLHVLTRPPAYAQIERHVMDLVRRRDELVVAIDRYEDERMAARAKLDEVRPDLEQKSIGLFEAYVGLTAQRIVQGGREAPIG